MTSRQKLSSLLIAATALLAASVPCFAQSQSVESRHELTSAAMTVVEPAIALNRERTTAESLIANEDLMPKSMTAVTSSANRPRVSLAMFKQSGSQFSTGESQRFVVPQSTIYDNRVDDSKKQFRADEDGGTASRPRVTFVPSRGQKLPD